MPDQYFGKYTGIVKDNADPQKLGQLQVSVPAIFPPEEHVTARAALPYGFFFIPEIEAKVWVEFEGGDSGLPIWSGIQYVPGEWAPEAAVDPPQKRVIKTASGHIVLFADKGGEERIEIHEGTHGHVVMLDQNGITLQDGVNRHAISLDSGGVTIKTASGTRLQLGAAEAKLETPSGAKVEVTAPLLSVDGAAAAVEVKGSLIRISGAAAMPILRVGDTGVGNLGAPVPLIGPGNLTVLA